MKEANRMKLKLGNFLNCNVSSAKNHTTKVQKPLLKANFSVGTPPASPERGGAAAAAEGLPHIVSLQCS